MRRTAGSARRLLKQQPKHGAVLARHQSSDAGVSDATWHIGDVSVPIFRSKSPERIPGAVTVSEPYMGANRQLMLSYLRWMAQKDLLGQDMCLCGQPGSERRWLALQFCRFAKREAYFMSLSRDTTESDLKQRKEIRAGTLHYMNQAAVRAATEGQVLILEGLERAERNVLPVLNNLLENREMHLDDGRMLLHPNRYDELVARMGEERVKSMGLLRVSERFRVVALTVPAAQYGGNPLDPPLRSRFQCLFLHPSDASAAWAQLNATRSMVTGAAAAGQEQERQQQAHGTIVKLREGLLQYRKHGTVAGETVATPVELPELGVVELDALARAAALFPLEPLSNIVSRVLPVDLYAIKGSAMDLAARRAEAQALVKRCGVVLTTEQSPYKPKVLDLSQTPHRVVFHNDHTAAVSVGPQLRQSTAVAPLAYPKFHFFSDFHHHVMQQLIQSHCSNRHVILVGPAGCGKTSIIREFASAFGYDGDGVETVHLYSDMTTRDLQQRRATDDITGDTVWELSGLLVAARDGKLAVLDGVEQLAPGSLAVLHALLVDGGVTLHDGFVFKPAAEYDTLLKHEVSLLPPEQAAPSVDATDLAGFTAVEAAERILSSRGVFRVHPSFRVIATARPPSGEHGKKFWLTPDIVSAFDVHSMAHMPDADVAAVLSAAGRAALTSPTAASLGKTARGAVVMSTREIDDTATSLVNVQRALEKASVSTPNVPQITLRQLLRVMRYVVMYPSELRTALHEALLTTLATPLVADVVRATIDAALGAGQKTVSSRAPGASVTQAAAAMASRILSGSTTASNTAKSPPAAGSLVVTDTTATEGVTIRTLSVDGQPLMMVNPATLRSEEKALVPHVMNYFENELHAKVAGWIVKQLTLNVPILLVGNQGVGKNKITDHVLATASLPRHYVQLHRDTTVASLTINPTVVGGQVVWEDSPLVKAATLGHVLVVDEIDKAPVEVVQILKGLIEDRELRLSDGRLITAHPPLATGTDVNNAKTKNKFVPLHPNFRVIVLANPPGFPFHGNDFYRECGDLFAAYVLSNPDASSLLTLLRKYGPNVPIAIVIQLITMFNALGEEWAAGRIQYPFSTRELIAVIKHLQAYPADGVYQALNNVFTFDTLDAPTMDTVRRLVFTHLKKNGAADLPFGAAAESTLDSVAESSDEIDLHLEKAHVLPVVVTSMTIVASSYVSPTHQEGGVKTDAKHLTLPLTFASVTLVDESAPSASTKNAAFTEVKATFDVAQLLERCVDAVAEVNPGIVAEWKAPTVKGVVVLPNNVITFLVEVRSSSAEDKPYFAVASVQSPAVTVSSSPCPIPHGKAAIVVVDGKHLLHANDVHLISLRDSTSVVAYSATTNRFLFLTPTTGTNTLATIPTTIFGSPSSPLVVNTTAAAHGCFSVTVQGSSKVVLWCDGLLRVMDFAEEGRAVLRVSPMSSSSLHVVVGESDVGARHFIAETPRRLSPEGDADVATNDKEAQLWRLLSDQPGALNGLELMPNALLSSAPQDSSIGADGHLDGAVAVDRQRNSLISMPSRRSASSKSKDSTQRKAKRLVLSSSRMDLKNATFDAHSRQLTSRNAGSAGGVNMVDTARGRARTVTSLGQKVDNQALGAGGNGVSIQGTSAKVFDALAERLNDTYNSWKRVTDPNLGGALGAPPTPKELDMWYSKPRKEPSGKLKHGEEDNLPHHGGNTYAGGTGGTDTAGLGGLIGPYRLDKGWDIHQVDPERKKQIPKHLIDEAKKMGQEALAKRLAEIGMSQEEYSRYMAFYEAVKAPTHQLRMILQGLKSKNDERVWLRHQTDGMWDDAKLVEGITGDKAIYKRRIDPENDPQRSLSHGSQKKKRLLFLFDISASMYRFNRHDQRLDRLMECAILVTEALSGYSDTIDYSIVGHNGDSAAISLVPWGKPPRDRKERYDLCATIVAHTQHCWTGDSTLQAMSLGIENVLKSDAEDYFVFLISDANLQQYGYKASDFSQLILREPRVKTYCIFIASFGAQASQLQQRLPAGRGFECMDTRELPQILKRIFVAANILGR